MLLAFLKTFNNLKYIQFSKTLIFQIKGSTTYIAYLALENPKSMYNLRECSNVLYVLGTYFLFLVQTCF